MSFYPNSGGWLEVIIGSMFSGKTTELLRRMDRMQRAGRRIQFFSRDSRYAENAVVSHDRRSHPATYATTSEEILAKLDWKTDIVGIDEGQFYDGGLVAVCRQLANEGKVVIVAGLDQDFKMEPFAVMMQLTAEAESVTKLNAVCHRCGDPAIRNFRKSTSEERIVVGSADLYEALCRRCYIRAQKELHQIDLFEKNTEKPEGNPEKS